MAIKKNSKQAKQLASKPADKRNDGNSPVVSANGYRLRRLKGKKNKKRGRTLIKYKDIPSAWKVLGSSLKQLTANYKLFGYILIIYGLLYVLLVKGVSGNFQLGNLRQSLNDALGGQLSTLGTGVALYGLLLGSVGSGPDATSGTYQTFLLILVSLALIWALRQTYGGQKVVRVKDSYYKSMHSLVPTVLVSLTLVLQMIPALLVVSLYSIIQANGVVVGLLEEVLIYTVSLLGIFISLYWASSTVFAFYIVTLPNTGPMTALRSAKQLVRYRRSLVVRKVIFLPLLMLLFSAVILVPLIIFLAPVAEVLFMLFTIVSVAVVHAYYYNLYRTML